MRALVTGGGGFLGSGIAKSLHNKQHDVTIVGRRDYPKIPEGIKRQKGDIRDFEFLRQSIKGIDAVFHTAAFPGIWGKSDDFYTINVDGTRNVIKSCLINGVQKLIFTSSPSVVYGNSDLEGVDETIPYPNTYLCEYPRTKAIAEELVIQANGPDLATVSIRPHLIWGPGDPHLIPRILAKADSGRLARVGQGNNKVDIIYIDNAVHAHIQACGELGFGKPCAGQVYFISDGEPVNLWDWINTVLKNTRRPSIEKNISYQNATRIGFMFEKLYGWLNIKSEPPMTRFLASQLATSHYFNISRARRDIGYEPVISPDEAMKCLIRSLKEQQ